MNLLLFAAGLVAGALNSVAGGGSFIALPALLYTGVAPVAANATSTLGFIPASAASAVAYRQHFARGPAAVAGLIGTSVIGGLLGGLLLVRTSDTSFMRLLPWLMLAAALTFTFGRQLTSRIRRPLHERSTAWALPLLLAISIYGGYFGGGMGIMILAVFNAIGMTDIHEMNGLKAIVAVAINVVALVEFVIHGVVRWAPGLAIAAGGIMGGYAGARLARRMNPQHVRVFVITIGWALTAYFFIRPAV